MTLHYNMDEDEKEQDKKRIQMNKKIYKNREKITIRITHCYFNTGY